MGVLSNKAALEKSRRVFESIYVDNNKREYVAPDPLQFLYRYERPEDKEVVGLIASSLAYGKVAQILKSVENVLAVLGPSPSAYLRAASRDELEAKLGSFVHRFTDGAELTDFLSCIKLALERYGSLEELFLSCGQDDMWLAADSFISALMQCGTRGNSFLLPRPSRGSACKRLWLYLRWMVRSDDVDPGCWRKVNPSMLFIPVDTHMFRICSALGMCERKNPDGRASREITEAFRIVCPEDPVRYDFALTRFGIRNDMTVEQLFERWRDNGYKI